MTDFLDQKRREIDARLKELKPLVDEYARLQAAAEALHGVGARRPRRPPARAARPKQRRAHDANPRPGAHALPAGRRAAASAPPRQTVVNGQPGITIPELAAKMGIKQNYLYRVLPGLEQEKKVRKDGRGWYPVAA